VRISMTSKLPSKVDVTTSDRIIPLSVPEIRGNEWKYLKECLDTNWLSSAGPFVGRFEGMVSEFVGANHGIATSSGTAALHIALLVAGVQPDDEVLVSTLTFIAPANTVRYVGAWPVFIDAEPAHWQMDVDKLVDFIESRCVWTNGNLVNKSTGRRIKAILPVHILGHPCDMDPIMEVAGKYNLVVVEDATEALGARYRGKSVAHLGHIGCLSFNGNKMISTGAGGMIVTDNQEWAKRARYLTTQAKDDGEEYIHNEIGYNYRLSSIQAAVGCAQVEVLDEYVATKRGIAGTYGDALGKIPGITDLAEATWADSANWLYTVAIDAKKYGMTSRALMERLRESGIQSRPLWQPLHLSTAHAGAYAHECTVAERLWHDGLSLPSSVGLTKEDQARVIQALTLAPAATVEL